MENLILLVVVAAVAIATYTDIRKREVPDWLNYGLAVFGIGANLLVAIAFWDWHPLAYSLVGAAVFFAIAYMMFYAGQWGGGDSKMLIGLGASFGLPFVLSFPYIDFNSILVAFWFNLLVVGVAYAFAWSVFVAFKNRSRLLRELRVSFGRAKARFRVVVASSLALLVVSLLVHSYLLRMLLALIAVLGVLTVLLSVFSRAVEKVGMIARVTPDKLTEGDWIARDVIVGKKRIAGPKDLGISKKQVRQLQSLYARRKLRTVVIKIGIPFVPSFLIALLVSILYGNLFYMVSGFF